MAYGAGQEFHACHWNLSMVNNQPLLPSTVRRAYDVQLTHIPSFARLQAVQPGCPAFLEAHNLLNSFTALMISGTPTGPSNGK